MIMKVMGVVVVVLVSDVELVSVGLMGVMMESEVGGSDRDSVGISKCDGVSEGGGVPTLLW